MLIRKLFPSKDIVEIQEELRKLYGNNFVIIELNYIKKKSLPFVPFIGKEYAEVIIEIPETPRREEKKGEKDFKKEVVEELIIKEITSLKEELTNLKEELKKEIKPKKVTVKVETRGEKLSEEDRKFLNQLGDEALKLLDLLSEKGFSEGLIVKILRAATGYDIEEELFDLKDTPVKALAEAFEKLFQFKNLESEESRKVVSLIGPTGVGKTTTIAKIVSNLVLNAQKSVGVISLDTFRVGGTNRLESFLKVLEIPFRKADTKKAFETAMEDFADKDFIFVDIAGRSVYDELSWKEVFNILGELPQEEVLPLLTLSFNMNPHAVLEIYEHLRSYPIKGIILTKADETSKRGTIFDAVERLKLPLYYFTNGQKVPHNILLATPSNLAKLIIN